METNPLISVIIPVYNSSKYLRRCLDSVLMQDYKNLEIVLVNDGSTDESPLICDEYAVIHKNIFVHHIPNGGASLARKKGLENACGQLISFVDSDDYVASNYISAMFYALQEYNTLVASCAVQITSKENQFNFDHKIKTFLLTEKELMFRFLNYEFWGLPGSLYRREAFDDIIFPTPTLSEDYYIKAQMFVNCPQMAYVSSFLYMYEKHEYSLSNTQLSFRAFEEFENVFQVYKLILSKMPCFQSLAIRNVVETCIKLLLIGSAEERRGFINKYKTINRFLKKNTIEIMKNPFLLRRQKFIALSLRFFPSLSRVYNYILR